VDSFEWNKIAGWTLAALIAVLGLVIVSGYIYDTSPPEKQGYVVEGVEIEAEAGAPAEVEKPIAFFLASASAEKGANVFKKCAACHTITKGGANGIGPNLWGIMGNTHAHIAGFGYSDAMLATKGQPWGWDEMDKWIKSPKAYIPGNKMSFAGISKPQDRADLFVYLNSQSDSPIPLPPVPAEEAAPADADAAGKAPDTGVEDPNAATAAQPQNNVGGPGAPEVTGTSENER
jgi:cytochrome c